MTDINLTLEQERIRNKITAKEFELVSPLYHQRDGLLPGSEVRLYDPQTFEPVVEGAGYDVLDVIILLGLLGPDFFVRYFGVMTHLFALGVPGRNRPFIYIAQGYVIKGWKSVQGDFGPNERGLMMR